MIHIPVVVCAWEQPDFKAIFKAEIEKLDSTLLPLQQGLTVGSYVSDTPFNIMIITISEDPHTIFVKAGIFYYSTVAGCNCTDDPLPVAESAEYCEVQFDINRQTAVTCVHLLQ